MSLNPDFHFSQNNLQDYVDCPRRFELRHIQHLEWPALQSEPVLLQEQLMVQGRQFHKMVQQIMVGLPVETLIENVDSANLAQWWDNFMQSNPLIALPGKRYVEHYLSCPLAGYRLTAQYDLLAVEPGKRAVILDWKTSSRKPRREFLKNRLQTRVYRYMLVEAGKQLNDNQPLLPEQVEMTYWFAEFPGEPEHFLYDQKQFYEDRKFLTDLVVEIAHHESGQFILTPDEKKCLYCSYRSLCNRGEKAGNWADQEEESETTRPLTVDLNFEQIGEVEF
ncbi:MAG TPA: PD-(D/E)XK nuclease family protein [Anaerolineaceae bacterium]